MTVTIFPADFATELAAAPVFRAVSGKWIAAGRTAGEALDALTQQFPETNDEPLLVVRRFRADKFFSAEQQQRLSELMSRWRQSRDHGGPWSAEEQTELEALVNAEAAAAGLRAADIAPELSR